MRRLFSLVLLGFLLACDPITPDPKPPPDQLVVDLSFGVKTPEGGYVSPGTIKVESKELQLNQFGFTKTTIRNDTDIVAIIEAPGFISQEIRERITRDRHFERTLVRDIPPMSRIRIEGTLFKPRLNFASLLSILRRSSDERQMLYKEVKDLGFNGFRVFAGRFAWADQTAESARLNLPAVLTEAAQWGLFVEVTVITDSALEPYDLNTHLNEVARLCQQYQGCILEAANEFWHSTQRDEVQDPQSLFNLTQANFPPDVPWGLGAPPYDEPQKKDPNCQENCEGWWPIPTGTHVTVHLDRSRDKWNQVRRVRELFGVAEETGKPVLNNEPIGAGEVMSGSRRNDPEFFYGLCVLNRFFEVGGVLHSEDGLFARPLGPRQKECASACVEGFNIPGDDVVYLYQNVGWSTSPIKSVDFSKVVRAYSFVSGNRGFTVLLGLTGDPRIEWQNGWREVGVAGEKTEIRILRIERS
jgi:hypothetical protein